MSLMSVENNIYSSCNVILILRHNCIKQFELTSTLAVSCTWVWLCSLGGHRIRWNNTLWYCYCDNCVHSWKLHALNPQSENFVFTCCSKRSDGARRKVVRSPEKLHRSTNTLRCFHRALYTEQYWIQKLDTLYTVSFSICVVLHCFHSNHYNQKSRRWAELRTGENCHVSVSFKGHDIHQN